MSALLLTLDGVLYQVMREGAGWRLLALQGKRVGASYLVTPGGCDCPAATYQPGPCKHRRAIAAVQLLPPVVNNQSGVST